MCRDAHYPILFIKFILSIVSESLISTIFLGYHEHHAPCYISLLPIQG